MYIIVIITFLVPYCKTGRDFIDQLTKYIDDWNNRSPMQHLALQAVIALLGATEGCIFRYKGVSSQCGLV